MPSAAWHGAAGHRERQKERSRTCPTKPLPCWNGAASRHPLEHVYHTLKVRRSAMEQAGGMAAAAGGNTSLATFIDRQELWTRGGAVETEVKEKGKTRYRFNATRCLYAEMYREMGLGEIGHLPSCQRCDLL